jgi:hypothetical protein
MLDPKDGTTELVMGASFHCPPPVISADKLVPFDVLQSNSVDVFTNADADVPGGDEHPKLNGDVVVQSGAWDSTRPVTEVGNKAKPWEAVKEVWMAPDILFSGVKSDDVVQDVLDATAALWSEAFGWGDFGGGGENQLKSQVNVREKIMPIVWDEFEGVYMAPPLIGVVG